MLARTPVVRHRTLRRRALRRRALWSCGELLVTVGTVLALLVVHQLWWTNRQAEQGAQREVRSLEKEWGNSASPGGSSGSSGSQGSGSGSSGSSDPAEPSGTTGRDGTRLTNSSSSTPSWSQAYAILSIPRLGLRVPVAEGVSKPAVLNKGYVGHYPGTQQPGQAGNFALAGHRNTHGEPFRYINRLRRGDAVQVETSDAVYSYTVDRALPQTSARDDGVIRAIPRSTVRPAYGYRTPGYYLTLTTCTPEYTSRYRLVVWARLTSMRPR
ncbi:class E sortase [Streptomyces sp. SID12488]|uniref:class E sortase n=1 Tax=Streptomyces sp. SID12488 TaxID=2706040 RepID=UPI0013DB00B2|nr:class E sortase [Streptomyces sp. SID12488]NEA61601.1 class E sortase [Streptomyces sp. SID12488]